MSDQVLASVFEPFVQVGASLSRSEGGLGIGLSLVRSIVELHRGRVTAHSDGPGRGSEFVVRLPLSYSVPAAPKSSGPVRVSRGLRVLVIEDNSDVRHMLKTLLELEGHDVEAANDGLQGLEMIELYQPDVALVDIGLPELDGYEVARQVRGNPENENVYLVALTGYSDRKDRRRALQCGFDAHLAKPVDLDSLTRLLAECARNKSGAGWDSETWTDHGR
jgi:CheY-like chemotaxis protein